MRFEGRHPETPDESPARPWLIGGAAALAVVLAAWLWLRREAPEEPAPVPVAAEPMATVEPRHPLPSAGEPADPAATAMPPRPAAEQVAELVGPARFETLFHPEDLLRRMVVTVDNLPRPKLPQRMNPAQPLAGEFVALGGEGEMVLGAENYARYAPWVEMIDAVPTAAAVALYRRLYPQLQASWAGLGNPTAYFNDRLVEVIDHLLATPEAPDTIELARPNVMYEFADPALESLSTGQKLLLRMGPGNAARVKAKLREFRAAIASG